MEPSCLRQIFPRLLTCSFKHHVATLSHGNNKCAFAQESITNPIFQLIAINQSISHDFRSNRRERRLLQRVFADMSRWVDMLRSMHLLLLINVHASFNCLTDWFLSPYLWLFHSWSCSFRWEYMPCNNAMRLFARYTILIFETCLFPYELNLWIVGPKNFPNNAPKHISRCPTTGLIRALRFLMV